MPSRVLIIIDLLNDFLNPKGALYCGDGARENYSRDSISH